MKAPAIVSMLRPLSWAVLVQVMKELQALAIKSELRFEVSKQTALAFIIKQAPADLHRLADSISQRHGIVSKQQAHRLDVAYCSFAAAAAATASAAVSVGGQQPGSAEANAHASSSTGLVGAAPDEMWLRQQIMKYFESKHELSLDGKFVPVLEMLCVPSLSIERE